MKNFRAFVALPLPDNIKREVDKLIVALKPLAGGITWVKAANLHFTLRFLGDIPSDSVSKLRQSLAEVSAFNKPIEISLQGIGCFPNMRRPRVIWLGANGDVDRMINLANSVEQVCRSLGFGEADKPFAPHLTIGRVKRPDSLEQLMAKIAKTDFDSERFILDEIIIFKSVLTPAGPIYTGLESIRLNKDDK